MILEVIVTTRNEDGTTNIAPMGPKCAGDDLTTFELRPFSSSRTYANLKRTGQGVLHVTDDVMLFAKSAIGLPLGEIDLQPAQSITGSWISECCRCHEFEVSFVDDSSERSSMQCRTLFSRRVRDFSGFNRARHAVIECCILATRVDFIPAAEIQRRFHDLQPAIQKTGGLVEREAFELLQQFVAQVGDPKIKTP